MNAAYRAVDGEEGIVSSMTQWDTEETRGWLVLQFTGLAALFVARSFLVVSIVPMSEELGWDERQCGIVLSSFYWGYVLTQVLGGSLSDRFGGDVVQWMGGVVWSLTTLSTLFLAQDSIWPLVFARFLTGLAQGMHYPALSSLVANKVPEQSKTKFFGIAHSGAFAGSMGVGFLGSLIIRWYHWKALVLIVGCLTLTWVVCLRLFSVAHQNKTHYRLLDGQPSSPTSRLKLQVHSSEFVADSYHKIPWRKLLSHSSVIAYLIGFTTESSYAHIIPSWSPTFFSGVFPKRTGSAWLYNGAPSLATALGAASGGVFINHLILQKYDLTFVRKFGSCISLLVPGVCLFLIGVIGRGDENYPFTLFLLLLSSYFFGYAPCSVSVNAMDLTPTYSGSLYGVGNALGTLPGVFAVLLIGYILHSTGGNWTLVFLLQAAILFAGCLVFLAYGSSQRLELGATAKTNGPTL